MAGCGCAGVVVCIRVLLSKGLWVLDGWVSDSGSGGGGLMVMCGSWGCCVQYICSATACVGPGVLHARSRLAVWAIVVSAWAVLRRCTLERRVAPFKCSVLPVPKGGYVSLIHGDCPCLTTSWGSGTCHTGSSRSSHGSSSNAASMQVCGCLLVHGPQIVSL